MFSSQAIDKDRERRKLREQQWSAAEPTETNDLEFESKQKAQDSNSIYEGLCFNLVSENGAASVSFCSSAHSSSLQHRFLNRFPFFIVERCKHLERAMDEWSSVLQSGNVNSVRNPKQTCSAIGVMAALFKLMGKVVKNQCPCIDPQHFWFFP